MTYSATITSKNQITIPVALMEKLNLEKGDKVLFSTSKNSKSVQMTTVQKLLDDMAGSLENPSKDLDKVIEESKAQYFSKNL